MPRRTSSSMERQRNPKTSGGQMEKLLQFMVQNPDFANGKLPGVDGRAMTQSLWENLAEILNSDKSGPKKPVHKWQKSWVDWKCNTKRKYAKMKTLRMENDNEIANHVTISKLEEKLLAFIMPESVADTDFTYKETEPQPTNDEMLDTSYHFVEDLTMPPNDATSEPVTLPDEKKKKHGAGQEIVKGGTTFMIGSKYPQLEFTATYLRLLQLIVICHFHWSLSARLFHREMLVQHVINPVLCLYILYCTTVALMGMVDVSGSWTECLRPYWLMLSSADFIVVQLFMVAGICITKRLKSVSPIENVKMTAHKRDFWIIVAAYELSAIVAVVYDAVMKIVGTEETGCSAVFAHAQFFYSSVFTVFVLVKFLVPTWTVLWIFHPMEEGCPHNAENALSSPSYDAACPSPGNQPPIKGCHAYSRMAVPDNPGSSDGMTDLGVGDNAHQHSAYFNPPLISDDGDIPAPGGKLARGLSTICEEASPSMTEGHPRPGEKIMLISNGAEVTWQSEPDKC
ncbi:uncharacterized protein [Hetaerina americana]|uniref:uncharacterized protein isoform X2 n=1 Tax=Hetaerina americana TaxID=62018 RepID=UPI003A7F31DD